MSFLGRPVERYQLDERKRGRQRATALWLMQRFAETFDEIEYNLLWENPTINAQAWRLAERRHVTVCGGLVRHSAMTACGIALMLAHETGHHLGGPPLDPDLRWPTWQGQADYWAAKEGMPKVFGRSACRLTLRGAREIAALHIEFEAPDDEPEMTPNERLAIFRAGALGESAPPWLHAAFARALEQRR
jgi:hypothetical protein